MAKRILVVDDEEDVTQLLSFNLRRAGFEVTVANSGEVGLACALAQAPDLILLDVMLPEIDGFAICEMLRRKFAIRIPIILLTACASEDARVIGLQLGGDDYVTKPFSPRELLLRVKRMLELGARESFKLPAGSKSPVIDGRNE